MTPEVQAPRDEAMCRRCGHSGYEHPEPCSESDCGCGAMVRASIDPAVELVLDVQEASELLLWLASLPDVACPPIGRQLRTALLEALAEL